MIAVPLKSFGPVSFGSGRDVCRLVFGAPSEREDMEGIDGARSEVWHYWDKGFSLFFDPDQDFNFVCAEVDNSVQLVMFDTPIFELSEQQLTQLLKSKGFNVTDTEQHEWGERRVSFDDIFADFYFEHGKMVSVNYSIEH
jgi:hypothetical protein